MIGSVHIKLDGCCRRRNVPGSITCWLQYYYSYSCRTDWRNALRTRVTGSHLDFFIIRHIPVILYSRLLSLPELNEESRPQCHKYSEKYGRRVVNYIRRLNNKIPQVNPTYRHYNFSCMEPLAVIFMWEDLDCSSLVHIEAQNMETCIPLIFQSYLFPSPGELANTVTGNFIRYEIGIGIFVKYKYIIYLYLSIVK